MLLKILFLIEKKKVKIDPETEYASVEDPLSMHRTASNETTLISQFPNITNEKNVIIAPGQGKNSFNSK